VLEDIEFSLWNAFWELSTERPIGMGTGPIPVSKIRSHARDFGMDAASFVRIMRRMDEEYLSHANRQDGKT
jgi:hypothetical protein